MYGNPETTPGGRALKFYCSVRLDIRRIGSIKDGEQFIGNRTRVKVVKNKVAAPFRMAEFEIIYGSGISHAGELLDFGEAAGIVQRSGSWYSCDGERLGQGRENARTFLGENPDIAGAIDAKLREEHGLPVRAPVVAAAKKDAGAEVAAETPAPARKRRATAQAR